MRIEGSSVLVAGGASGLGAATARRLRAGGAEVTIADLNADKGAELAEELGARFVECDVTDAEQVGAAVEAAGTVRISVCCAGIGWAEKTAGRRGPHSFDPFEAVIRVNLIGTFNVLRLAAAAMLANEPDDEGERGVCINTASIAAYDGQIGQLAYSASKGGIVGMTLPAARDLAQSGIRVVHDRSRAVRHAAARPACPRRRARRSASRSRTRTASAGRRSTATSPPTSSRTRC